MKHIDHAITVIGYCLLVIVFAACQDKDIDREAMKLTAPNASEITGQLNGDDYTWTWPAQQAQMQVTIYRNGTLWRERDRQWQQLHAEECSHQCALRVCIQTH